MDSIYYKRWWDVEECLFIADRVASLIIEVAGGVSAKGVVDCYPSRYEQKEVAVNFDKINKFIGKEIPKEIVIDILTRLQMQVKEIEGNNLKILPPSFRGDIERAADIYEEIARMYGFENIEDKMPEENIKSGVVSKETALTDFTKSLLKEIGLQEVINYSFILKMLF